MFKWNTGYFQESNSREYWEVGFKFQAEKFSLYSASNTETLQDSKQVSGHFGASYKRTVLAVQDSLGRVKGDESK